MFDVRIWPKLDFKQKYLPNSQSVLEFILKFQMVVS